MGKKKVNFDEFVRRSREKHGGRYHYSPASYNGTHKNTLIICPDHGEFSQHAGAHYEGRGCPMCDDKRIADLQRLPFSEFVIRAREKHGDRYEYLPEIYNGSGNNTNIVCREHGMFVQRAAKHLRGGVCPVCAKVKMGKNKCLTTAEFVDKATVKHKGRYNYAGVQYTESHAKVEIVCPDHGVFFQTPNAHLKGQGCPGCIYKKEAEVGNILLELFERVARQAPIKSNGRRYWFDYQIQDFDRLVYVEYHGEQHYMPVDFARKGDEWARKKFEQTQRRDRIKAEWCKRNNYPLIIVPYSIKDIRNHILSEISKFTT